MKHVAIDIRNENRRLPGSGGRAFTIGLAVAVLGVLGVAAGAVLPGAGGDALTRLLWSYFVNWVFFLSLAIGALFFVLINHVTHAGWSVVVRRFAEAVAVNLWLLGLLAIPLLLGGPRIWEWMRHEVVEHDHLVEAKTAYLNLPFFVIRLAVYFVAWAGMAWWFHRQSVAQDADADPERTVRMERRAAPGLVVFALTVTFASFDLLMSLDPRWFSSIFGVYFFSGAFVGFVGLLALITLLVQRAGRLTHAITKEHFHDIGKYLLAFVVFWAYIAFSQYMLIWYANLPEETVWVGRRQQGGWGALSIVLLVGHFALPFLALLSRLPKRRPLALGVFATWMLAMHWIDLYWVAMPEMNREAAGRVPFNVADLGFLLLLGGLLTALTARRLAAHSLIAEGDPRIVESLTFENV